MSSVVCFKIVQLMIAVLLCAYVSDVRRTQGATALVFPGVVVLLKAALVICIAAFVATVATMRGVFVSDYVGCGIMAAGTALVFAAKHHISRYHTWAGCGLTGTVLVTTGPYRFVRHPLYAGVYVCIAGAAPLVIRHSPWYVKTPCAVLAVYIVVCLKLIADREDEFLSAVIGNRFMEYRKSVHQFLPLAGFGGNSRDQKK